MYILQRGNSSTNANGGNFSKVRCLSFRGPEVKSLEYEVIAIAIKMVPPFYIHHETLK